MLYSPYTTEGLLNLELIDNLFSTITKAGAPSNMAAHGFIIHVLDPALGPVCME